MINKDCDKESVRRETIEEILDILYEMNLDFVAKIIFDRMLKEN